MPIFEYKCPDCGLLNEHLTLGSQEVPATIPCKRCKAASPKREVSNRPTIRKAISRVLGAKPRTWFMYAS